MDIEEHVHRVQESIVQVKILLHTNSNSIPLIISTDVVNCTNWSVRLVDGESDNEGKVEICVDGIWMTTEANYWSYSHAEIVCRQLGYYDKCKINVETVHYHLHCRVSCYQRYVLEN